MQDSSHYKSRKENFMIMFKQEIFSSKLKCLKSFKYKIAEMSGKFHLSSQIENNPKPIFCLNTTFFAK